MHPSLQSFSPQRMSSSSIRFDNFLDRESSLGVLLMLPGLSILAVFWLIPLRLAFGCL